jgi:putative FmdB family regulatory protein
MPTYQYRCTECGEDLEAVQKFSDAALTECPRCGGPLRKLFNAVGVVFKGSGFYRTDSRASTSPESDGSKPEKKSADAGKEVAAKANANGSAASDKAPASSPATDAPTVGSGSRGRSQKVGATTS